MGASLVVALKLCGGRGVYEGRKLAEFHDPRPRHRLPSAAVSAEKRPRGEIQIFGVFAQPWRPPCQARASSPMGMLPPAARERGLLRYSAGQRAPACFYASYSVYLAATGTPSYAPPPPQPRGAPSAAPSSARRCGDSARPPFSISHLFIFLPALVWPGYRAVG